MAPADVTLIASSAAGLLHGYGFLELAAASDRVTELFDSMTVSRSHLQCGDDTIGASCGDCNQTALGRRHYHRRLTSRLITAT